MEGNELLVRLLDARVFDPILEASADRYSGHEREQLRYIQDRTRAEKQRYHSYDSAEKVVQMFHADLRSESARTVKTKLQELKLPCLADVEEEFNRLAA